MLITDILTVIGGHSGSGYSYASHFYSLLLDNDGVMLTYLGQGQDSPVRIYFTSYARQGSTVHLVGGDLVGGDKYTVYDSKSGLFTRMSDMNVDRSHYPPTFILDNHLYVTGGIDYTNFLTSMSSYPLSGGSWSEVSPSLPYNIYETMAVVRQNRVYITDGRSRGRIVNSMLSWSAGDSAWNTSLARLNTARFEHCTVYCYHYIFVLGGYDGNNVLNSVELYNFDQNTWVTKSDMLQSLVYLGCACYKQSHIIVTGGRGSGGRSNRIYICNIATDTWTESPTTLTEAVSEHVSVIFNDDM